MVALKVSQTVSQESMKGGWKSLPVSPLEGVDGDLDALGSPLSRYASAMISTNQPILWEKKG